jgi:hypothetical protein
MRAQAPTPQAQAKKVPVDQAARDPVLSMLGIGKHLWEGESGDRFVDRLRSEDAPPPPEGQHNDRRFKLAELVWRRIKDHQGENFHTVTGKSLTYVVEGAGI